MTLPPGQYKATVVDVQVEGNKLMQRFQVEGAPVILTATATLPEWKLELTTDTWALYVDPIGVEDPEVELWNEDGDSGKGRLFRFPLPRLALCCDEADCTKTHLVAAHLKSSLALPLGIHQYKEWFSDRLSDVARWSGLDVKELRALLCSEAVLERVHGYLDIAGHYGAANFDQYPDTITAKQWKWRCTDRSTPQPEDDDTEEEESEEPWTEEELQQFREPDTTDDVMHREGSSYASKDESEE